MNFSQTVIRKLLAYDVDVLAKSGQIIHAIPRERINPAGVPFKGNIIRQDNRLINLAISVAKELNLSYLYDLDIMTRKNGRSSGL